MDRLHVATLNILNLADRWPERLPLLLADMAALQPDLLGLQEVVYVMQQDRLIGAAGEGRYGAVRGWAGRPEYGNSLLVKEPLTATQVDRLDLGLGRSAHRAVVALPGGAALLVVVTHLHHTVDGDAAARRAGRRAARLAGRGAADRCDGRDGRLQCRSGGAHLRADARGRLRLGLRRGQRRGAGRHLAVRGSRRRRWTPTATRTASTTSGCAARPASSTRGSPSTGPTRVDPTLYPSDHLGISAHLEIG